METTGIKPEELRLILTPSADDPPIHSPEYQRDLHSFSEALETQGIQISSRWHVQDAVGASGFAYGDFGIIASFFGPVVGVAIGAFLKGRYGRKVSLKIGKTGEIQATAQTVEQVDELVKIARTNLKPPSH
jgi:hypothetical protein